MPAAARVWFSPTVAAADYKAWREAEKLRSPRGNAENFAQVRRRALNLLKQHPDESSVACKRPAAA